MSQLVRTRVDCQVAARPRHKCAILPSFLMAVRVIHGLFGLKAPAPPRSTWHDRLRVRQELRGIAPHRPSACTRLVRHLPLTAIIAGCILIAGGSRLLPEEVVLEMATATIIASRPITVGQIAAFAELAPLDILERVRTAIDEQMQLRVRPLSFASVASDVMIAACRGTAEDSSSGQNQLVADKLKRSNLPSQYPDLILRPSQDTRRADP